MELNEIIKLDKAYHMNTFGERIPVAFKYGDGINLYDINGIKYTDFFSGIAVNCLGYGNKNLIKAICSQAEKLIHCSNYYYIENQAILAEKLSKASLGGKVFFTNSGAEANETAIKLARAYFRKQGYKNKYTVLSLNSSFHGRTLATVAATGTEKYQEPFKPMPDGFIKASPGDLDEIDRLADEKVCAIMIEPVMCEGGLITHTAEYFKGIRDICTERNILMIADEVQTGFYRTGTMFGYMGYNVIPDIITLAKALGGGMPIGACLASPKTADTFTPGDHGSTYAGNPLACASSLAVLNEMEQPEFINNVVSSGNHLKEVLQKLKAGYSFIEKVCGKGLAAGIQLNPDYDVNKYKMAVFDKRYLVGTAGGNTLRFLPPLITTKAQIDDFHGVMDDILQNTK